MRSLFKRCQAQGTSHIGGCEVRLRLAVCQTNKPFTVLIEAVNRHFQIYTRTYTLPRRLINGYRRACVCRARRRAGPRGDGETVQTHATLATQRGATGQPHTRGRNPPTQPRTRRMAKKAETRVHWHSAAPCGWVAATRERARHSEYRRRPVVVIGACGRHRRACGRHRAERFVAVDSWELTEPGPHARP